MKLSGPPRPAAGRPRLVRETSFLEALIQLPRTDLSTPQLFPWQNKGLAVHKSLHPYDGEVIDIKESFTI